MLKTRNKEATMLKRWKRVWLPLALIGALSLATALNARTLGGHNHGGFNSPKVTGSTCFPATSIQAVQTGSTAPRASLGV